MFKLIGGAVVCGLAIYGLIKYLERPLVAVTINPAAVKDPGVTGEALAEPVAEPTAAQTPDQEAPKEVE